MHLTLAPRLLALLLLPLLAAAPASQPAKPKPDEQVITDAERGFTFAVPKNWRRVEQPGDTHTYVFQMPAVGESRKSVPTWILLIEPGKPGDDVAAVRERVRERIMTRNAKTKLEVDKALTIAGQDAWEFVYPTTVKVTITEKTGKRVEDVPIKVRDQVFFRDGNAYEFVLTSDEKGYAIRTKMADRILATFGFTGNP